MTFCGRQAFIQLFFWPLFSTDPLLLSPSDSAQPCAGSRGAAWRNFACNRPKRSKHVGVVPGLENVGKRTVAIRLCVSRNLSAELESEAQTHRAGQHGRPRTALARSLPSPKVLIKMGKRSPSDAEREERSMCPSLETVQPARRTGPAGRATLARCPVGAGRGRRETRGARRGCGRRSETRIFRADRAAAPAPVSRTPTAPAGFGRAVAGRGRRRASRPKVRATPKEQSATCRRPPRPQEPLFSATRRTAPPRTLFPPHHRARAHGAQPALGRAAPPVAEGPHRVPPEATGARPGVSQRVVAPPRPRIVRRRSREGGPSAGRRRAIRRAVGGPRRTAAMAADEPRGAAAAAARIVRPRRRREVSSQSGRRPFAPQRGRRPFPPQADALAENDRLRRGLAPADTTTVVSEAAAFKLFVAQQ